MIDAEEPQAGRAEMLIADRQFPWIARCPYDELNEGLAAIGEPQLSPLSSIKEVRDSFFSLQAGATPGLRNAWDQLRRGGPRLVVDFFHYSVPALDISELPQLAAEQPMPVEEPDVLEFAGLGEDEADLQQLPEKVRMPRVETEGIAVFTLAEMFPQPLCEAKPTLESVLEAENDN